MLEIDELDKKILSLLQSNCKYTVKEISDKVGLSPTPVHERIKKMERQKIITGYHAKLDPALVGLDLLVFCNVSLTQHSQEYLLRFEEEVHKFKEVLECFHTAGSFDYLLKIRVKDMAAYQDFIVNRLAVFEYIGKVESSFVMTVVHSSDSLNLR